MDRFGWVLSFIYLIKLRSFRSVKCMKSILLVLIFLFSIACQQEDVAPKTQVEAEVGIIADSEDVGTSGGTEVVAKSNTTPPEFKSFYDGTYQSRFRIKFKLTGTLSIAQISLLGMNKENSYTSSSVISATHSELFNGNFTDMNEYQGRELLVEVELSESIILTAIGLTLNPNSMGIESFEVYSVDTNAKLIYSAENLQDKRVDFIILNGATRFDVRKTHCEGNKKQNYNGQCYIPRVLCSDFNSDYEFGKKRCRLDRDQDQVYCQAVNDKSSCESLKSSVCERAKDYLSSGQTRLFTLFYENYQIHSEVCNIPKK